MTQAGNVQNDYGEKKKDGETEDDEGSKTEKNSSECFFAGKGTALVLALKDIPHYTERRLSTDSTKSTNSTQSNSSDIQQHLQSMFYLLRHEETLKMAVKLESQRPNRTRYLVIASRCCFRNLTTDRKNKISRNNSAKITNTTAVSGNALRQHSADSSNSNSCIYKVSQPDPTEFAANTSSIMQSVGSAVNIESNEKRGSSTSASATNRTTIKNDSDRNNASGDNKCVDGIEESCLLGIDCNERTTIGLVVPILADTTIHLDGDGGFSVAVYGKTHIFKPVSVQAMWSALQTLHKVSQKARENNFYPGGPSHDWLSYYESRIESDQSCLNEWNAMDSIESRRPPSPDAIRNKPTAKEETEGVIKMKLKEIMMSVDLDEVTSKYIRGRLEEHLDMDLGEYKSFIDEEMLMILGQMDAPTEIFDHVYLGSEWNASNLEELQKNGVRHILNVTREIDNFFPGIFDYFNVRVYDDEKTNLLKHWDNTFRYINRAKDDGSKVLVHCKMGVSRSASVVIAYAMKAYNWEFQQALQHVKERRNCIKPNKNFLNQLETYRGMLDAMKNKEKLQRSKSETNLKSTKDARLLPGSEPTPLIQALNQSKFKTSGHGVVDGTVVEVSGGIVSVSSINSASDNKQRRLMRRSSSTSPKSIQSHTAIVMKQQSQSLENLTPERSIADEPKNVRFPGNNGENYSVTQNQVLHIQKNTPPSQPSVTSVKTIVSGLESNQDRKTVDDRKSLNLQFSRSVSVETSGGGTGGSSKTALANDAQVDTTAPKPLGSPVWTSSAKLITQTSNIPHNIDTAPLRGSFRLRRDNTNSSSVGSGDMFSAQVDNVFDKEEVRHTRKTHSWAPSTGGIVMDHVQSQAPTGFVTASRQSSTSSIDSAATINNCENPNVVTTTRAQRQRELPSRHSSWGSGDNRSSLPIRNSSWGSYDTNRNTFQYGSSAATAAAIIEGQIHELNMSTKTANTNTNTTSMNLNKQQQVGTVKRTKQKLEECTVLKKLCQENGADNGTNNTTNIAAAAAGTASQKRSSNLYRSQSAAATTRSRFPNRCNSEEIMSLSLGGLHQHHRHAQIRRSDGSKPMHSSLFSASAPESYTMSDIENKNTPPQQDDDTTVMLRHHHAFMTTSAAAEEQRISGNVQILKKNFEAKAGNKTHASGISVSTSATSAKKGHQSLPSSPVAQHMDHIVANTATATVATANNYFIPLTTTTTATTSCYSTITNSNSSIYGGDTLSTATTDRTVKVLVDKYQATTVPTSSSSDVPYTSLATGTSAGTLTTTSNNKSRPRSYYENRHLAMSADAQQHAKSLGKLPPHGYSDCRPPPAPVKNYNTSTTLTTSSTSAGTAASPALPHHSPQQPMTESILTHQHQQRKVQQHGKTHPLARLSLPKQSFNAAAYNTM